MRPIAGTDILNFHASGDDLLVLTADGEYAHMDTGDIVISSNDRTRADAYSYVMTTDDTQVQVLLERRTIEEGEWFPDALDEDSDLIPSFADDMAAIINSDGILPSAIHQAKQASVAWETASGGAEQAAVSRSRAVATVVAFAGGNQSAAARLLGLDQSRVNKLVKKARAAELAATAEQTTEYALWDDTIPGGLTLADTVTTALGDNAASFDTDALEADYRAAVNAVLAEYGVTLAGEVFYGPYPRTMDRGEIADAVGQVDFWEIAARHDRDAVNG